MNKITEKIFETCPCDCATDTVVANFVSGSSNRLKGLIKRAIAGKELTNVRRGLYCLTPKYQKRGIEPFSLAQLIYGPSYISLESALSYHGWIPEAVYSITNASTKVSKEFSTEVGLFSYTRIPQKEFYAGVERVADSHGGFFLMARPVKALIDYIYVHKKDWKGIHPVIESLRVEPEELQKVTRQELDELTGNYNNLRVRQFINGFRKDLGYER
jgi:hypothetical protein